MQRHESFKMNLSHAVMAMRAVVGRETNSFVRQPGRLMSALVRPLLWLLVFAAGFQNVFGVAIAPPYETYITYSVYVVPGLLGMVALFNGMQSSLAMVYDREMGVMRLLLTAPLPRAWILACKLAAGSMLSFLQMLAFLVVSLFFGIELELIHVLIALPVLLLTASMLAALGLVLSVYVKQLENFAGTMNFVIFPMFFLSTALYPLWKLEESGATVVYVLAKHNPLTQAIEAMRFALYGQWNAQGLLTTSLCALAFFAIALWGYDPQRGVARAAPAGGKPAGKP
jgi:ABC-2 type transport system permease protein